jgi:hypothetical protein
MKVKEKLIRIITGIICGLCVLSLIVTIVSSISMILGFDINIQSRLLTLISTSDIVSTEISFLLILICISIGILVCLNVNKNSTN